VKPLYRLFLSTQATKGRLIGLLALGAVAVVLGFSIHANSAADPIDDGTILMSAYGLGLFVPVATLVFASSVLGEPNEDGTLVYLWLRPIARWRIVGAALAATLTVTLPVVVVPMVAAAAVTGAGAPLVKGTLAACVVATVAYAGVFTWLGLRVKRALVWGLAYILIWEGFVARAGANPSRLAIRANARSLLTHISGGPHRLIEVSAPTAVILPLVAFVVAVVLTVRRLTRQDVA
jgi:ABC-2 type transport system permease protein